MRPTMPQNADHRIFGQSRVRLNARWINRTGIRSSDHEIAISPPKRLKLYTVPAGKSITMTAAMVEAKYWPGRCRVSASSEEHTFRLQARPAWLMLPVSHVLLLR